MKNTTIYTTIPVKARWKVMYTLKQGLESLGECARVVVVKEDKRCSTETVNLITKPILLTLNYVAIFPTGEEEERRG